nr:MAG TPA: hypothetical protein [Caudoviricetes sp.]
MRPFLLRVDLERKFSRLESCMQINSWINSI